MWITLYKILRLGLKDSDDELETLSFVDPDILCSSWASKWKKRVIVKIFLSHQVRSDSKPILPKFRF